MATDALKCPNCGIPIYWEPFKSAGRAYCWAGCAAGDPVPRLRLEHDPLGRDEARFFVRA